MKRREFTKLGAALAINSGFPNILRPPNQYRVAIIGAGWWGNNILFEAMSRTDCKVVGICDVDRKAVASTLEKVKSLTSDTPPIFDDYREMMQKVNAHIAIVASPDHWHALHAIEAIKRGAHVYIEKPISHTINEGIAILKAARDNDRVVQVGTHRRVSPHNISAMEFLKSGKAGQISLVKCFINYAQGTGKFKELSDPPEDLDWNNWIGPAKWTDYHKGIHPRGFRQYLNFANGTIGDWGIHWFDQVLWWTDERAPKKVYSSGDRYFMKDNSDAPDTQLAIYDFEKFTVQWEHKLGSPAVNEDHSVGCYFYGKKGTLHLGWRDGWTFYPKNKNHSTIHTKPQLNDPDDQNIKELWHDMIQSIESKSKPVCDIEHGFLATNMSLLAMISYQVGRSIEWDQNNYTIVNDSEAKKLLRREYRDGWEYPI